MNPKNKVFIITGASSGIGAELAIQLSRKGASVVCAARTKEKLEDVCHKISKNGGRSLAVQADITDKNQCDKIIDAAIKKYKKVDALVLNAGISMWAKFDKINDVRFFKDIMNTNYMGSVYCVHSALPFLKKTKGKIVSCSTGQAIMGFLTILDMLLRNTPYTVFCLP